MANLKSTDLCERCYYKGTPAEQLMGCDKFAFWTECENFVDAEEYIQAVANKEYKPFLDFLDECVTMAPMGFGVCSMPFVLLKQEFERLALENYHLRAAKFVDADFR